MCQTAAAVSLAQKVHFVFVEMVTRWFVGIRIWGILPAFVEVSSSATDPLGIAALQASLQPRQRDHIKGSHGRRDSPGNIAKMSWARRVLTVRL